MISDVQHIFIHVLIVMFFEEVCIQTPPVLGIESRALPMQNILQMSYTPDPLCPFCFKLFVTCY
jgi:hypothetical protein